MRSGKTDVLWNGVNMSHSFREVSSTGTFEYSWQTRTGEHLQVIGYPGSTDYELLVDGTKFTDLPDLNNLRQPERTALNGIEQRSEDAHSLLSHHGTELCNDRESDRSDPFEIVPYGSGFRLSLAGLKSQGQEVEDELRSNLPLSSLDTLRDEIVSAMPDAEEMVSRAMLNALLDEAISLSRPNLPTTGANGSFQIETEMLMETMEWINIHRFCTDLDDMKYAIMQKHVDAVFAHVYRERMSVAEALRALISVACLLRLKVSRPVANNTIIVLDLAKQENHNDLIEALAKFGEIEDCAIVQGTGFGEYNLFDRSRKFERGSSETNAYHLWVTVGVCRFRLETSVNEVLAASQAKRLSISGSEPRVLPGAMSNVNECLDKGTWGNIESITDCDACLGAPLRYLISSDDDYEFQSRGFDLCGSMPSLRSVVSGNSYPSSSVEGGARQAMGHDFVGKATASTDTMPSMMSIDSISSALTSMDSSYLALCTSFER